MVQVSKIYEKSTRATYQENYFIPFSRTSKLQRSIKYQGPSIWSSLEQKLCKSIRTFKFKLKQYLLSQYHSD